jgi:hypothetical protein
MALIQVNDLSQSTRVSRLVTVFSCYFVKRTKNRWCFIIGSLFHNESSRQGTISRDERLSLVLPLFSSFVSYHDDTLEKVVLNRETLVSVLQVPLFMFFTSQGWCERCQNYFSWGSTCGQGEELSYSITNVIEVTGPLWKGNKITLTASLFPCNFLILLAMLLTSHLAKYCQIHHEIPSETRGINFSQLWQRTVVSFWIWQSVIQWMFTYVSENPSSR